MYVKKKSTLRRVKKNKYKLEEELNIKIEVKDNEIILEGNPLDLYAAENVINALDRNFPLNVALLLKRSDYVMEDIPIKNLVRKGRNLEEVRGRIIGTKGKSLKLISDLSECYVVLHENVVSLIGTFEKIKDAQIALQNLIKGSKHSKVYNYLERTRKKPKIYSLGLKKK